MSAPNPQMQLPDKSAPAGSRSGARESVMNNAAMRLFGGPPLAVVVRLILLSILVGVVLHASGLDPWNILDSIRRFFLSIWNMGFDAVRWLWRYFLLGAVVVVPIWIIVRLVRAPLERR
jgi:Family of unknown function (DUF6460)